MKKLFLLLLPVMMLGLTACGTKLTAEQAENAVLDGERDRLPLILQTLPFVDDIMIDSIHLTVTDEPMQGYLYTTWKKGKKEQSIIVPVDSICQDKTHKGYIQWHSAWDNAARSYIMRSIRY